MSEQTPEIVSGNRTEQGGGCLLMFFVFLCMALSAALLLETIHPTRHGGSPLPPKPTMVLPTRPHLFTKPEPEVPAPADRPPSKIAVNGQIYTVKYIAHYYFVENECLAFTDFGTHEIALDPTRAPAEIREYVLHELMHASLHAAGGMTHYGGANNNDGAENVINPVAPELLWVLRDNPKLADWLLR